MSPSVPVSVAATTLEGSSPFKGESSFGTEDESIFFGREEETQSLMHRILASHVTVLHAPSGAGKTSLLNARIIPRLEREGWMAVKTRPENHPARAIQSAVVQYMFPSPHAEMAALRRGRGELKLTADTTVKAFVETYERLEPGDRRRRALVASPSLDELRGFNDRETSNDARAMAGLRGVRPLICRVLSGTMDWPTAFRHWALFKDSSVEPSEEALMNCVRGLGDLEALLDGEDVRGGYATLMSLVSPPIPGLLSFFRNLTPWCLLLRENAQMVLLLDQFEEIFTRFQDHGRFSASEAEAYMSLSAMGRPRLRSDWRLRREFFDELEGLYAGSHVKPSLATGTSTELIPIRFVVSLRDEYVARLGPLRRFAPTAGENTYRLEFLSESQARTAIEQPINEAHRRIDPECVELVISELQLEDEFVEPGPLQLVCKHLWMHAPGESIGVGALQHTDVGGVRGVLGRYFRDAIARVAQSLKARDPVWTEEYARLELLDLLSSLVTSSGTRNVVEKHFLVNVPYRRPQPREALLDILEELRLVRRDVRLNEEYYEVTHEFLLAPIHAELRQSRAFGELTRAVSALRHALDYPYELISVGSFKTLHEHRTLFAWDVLGSEIMLRNAVAYAGDASGDDAVRFWAEGCGVPEASSGRESVRTSGTQGLVTLARMVAAEDRILKELTASAKAGLLRSTIMSGRIDAIGPLLSRMLGQERTA